MRPVHTLLFAGSNMQQPGGRVAKRNLNGLRAGCQFHGKVCGSCGRHGGASLLLSRNPAVSMSNLSDGKYRPQSVDCISGDRCFSEIQFFELRHPLERLQIFIDDLCET